MVRRLFSPFLILAVAVTMLFGAEFLWSQRARASTVVDSYSETNQDVVLGFSLASTQAFAQSFTGNGATLVSAVLYLKKFGTPTGNVTANIYTHSGTFGSTGIPTGTALATSATFNVATLTTSLQLITFTFSGADQIVLANGTNYFVDLEWSGTGNGADFPGIGADASSPTHTGNKATKTSGTWTSLSTQDIVFYVNGNLPPSVPSHAQVLITGGKTTITGGTVIIP